VTVRLPNPAALFLASLHKRETTGREKDGNEVERPRRKAPERTEKHGIAEKWGKDLGQPPAERIVER